MWVGDRTVDTLISELEDLLHSDDIDSLREIVFYLYRGSPHDSLLFGLCDALNGKMTICAYKNVHDYVRDLQKKLRKKNA
jgi:hypothetical protein